MRLQRSTLLVAIVGGSGAGKTWLAKKLAAALGWNAAHISLDSFYRDRSRVPLRRRIRINFDHPRAIDWQRVERALDDVCNGRATLLPCYDFKAHCRMRRPKLFRPRPLVLVDGLWLLRRRSLRTRFALSVFIRCGSAMRLRRRLARDVRLRGRSGESVRQQFLASVEPMHARYVAPQERWANLVLQENFGLREVRELAAQLRGRLNGHAIPPRNGDGVRRRTRRHRKSDQPAKSPG